MVEAKDLKNLLSQVGVIADSFERVAQATGENFNVFQIFNLERDENRMHSRFIETLLNPNGKHGQGRMFLELFLEILEIEGHLDVSTTQSKVEYTIGNKKIDGMYSKGGRIDIYLWDANGKSISIENKIDAIDQEKQLVRYYNHNQENNLVFYLTLNGDDTGAYSKGSLVSDKDDTNQPPDFYCISYKETILNWLEKCQKEASDFPILRETVKQYTNLIKNLTHQNISNKMNQEIIKLLIQNEDNLKSAKTISAALESIKSKLHQKLDELFEKAVMIKNWQDETSIFHEIKVLPNFPYGGNRMIRFDFFTDKINVEHISCQIQTDYELLKLKVLIWGKGEQYDKLNQKMAEDHSFLNLPEIHYNDDADQVISQIKSNFKAIDSFLKGEASSEKSDS